MADNRYNGLSRLSSTDFLSDNVSGKVASYIDYDAWGAPVKKAVLKLGARELDLVVEYTGHPYDQVLGLYFAEARMYDAADKRFVAVDRIIGKVAKPSTMVPYVYVLDNPLKFVDPWGKYFIKKASDSDYYAVPQSENRAVLSTVTGLVPAAGGGISALIKASEGLDTVGGNSQGPVGALMDLLKDEATSKAAEAVLEAALKNVGASVAKESAGNLVSFLPALTFWTDLENAMKIPQMDDIAFLLFDMAQMEPRARTKEKVDFIMQAAYSFINYNAWFFVDPTYQYAVRNVLGGHHYFRGPTIFTSLRNLKFSENQGESTEKIQEEISAYYQNYSCRRGTNKYLDSLYVVYLVEVTYPVKAVSGHLYYYEDYYHFALNNYNIVWEGIAGQFKSYINAWIELYDRL